MIAKFTPGPWFVVPQGCFVADRKVEFDGDGARVGETPNMCIECASEADAHLIAAAPEMYEAAEAALECLENNGFGKAYVEGLLRNAMLKARGDA